MRSIFVLAYYSYLDPIFQSAVLPYFQQLPGNFEIIILTFEQQKFRMSRDEFDLVVKKLRSDHIILYRTTWNSGLLKPFKKLLDLTKGIILSRRLSRSHSISLVYSEGLPGAIIAHFALGIKGFPHVIHSFEPHADYMLESGVWKKYSWEYLLQRYMEKKLVRTSDIIFTATQSYINKLSKYKPSGTVVRLPSCVETDHFRFDKTARFNLRKEFNFSNNDIVICYLGKFGGMYMDNELFEFFKLCKEHSNRFQLCVFTIEEKGFVNSLARKEGISSNDFVLLKLEREEIPKYLSACDWGFIGVRNFPSKRFCSPIKSGEYWSIGLPIIILNGVSDDFEFVKQYGLGISTENLDASLVKQMLRMNDLSKRRDNIRHFCLKDRDIRSARGLISNHFENLLPKTDQVYK